MPLSNVIVFESSSVITLVPHWVKREEGSQTFYFTNLHLQECEIR